MTRRILSWAGFGAVLVAVIILGWLAHAYRIDAHVAVFFQPRKKIVTEAPTPAATSTEVTMQEGDDREHVMNDYWLSRINDLRAQKNLLPLTFDSRLAATAKVWATQMGMTGVLSHDRPDGESVHDWIKPYNLPFTDRGPGGWNGNYFTENIGRAYADDSTESIQKGLDQVLDFMVAEGPDGDHYRTIFSPDWNRYGGGFYFVPAEGGRLQIYMAFHYASLK